MRRVRLIRKPGLSARPFGAREPAREERKRLRLEEESEFYRHRCPDSWLEELLRESGLVGKRLDPVRARKLLLAAVRKRLER